jgi:hypothetical protein
LKNGGDLSRDMWSCLLEELKKYYNILIEERAKSNYYESALEDLTICFIPWDTEQGLSNLLVNK